jgi:hypothetical protein
MSILSRLVKKFKNDEVEQVRNAIDRILKEPEVIDEMVPACKDCTHCSGKKDQHLQRIDPTTGERVADPTEYPFCIRPTGGRDESITPDWYNGIIHHTIARVNQWCWSERQSYPHAKKYKHFRCGRNGQYFKAKL